MKEPNGTCYGIEKPYSEMPVSWLQEAITTMPANGGDDRCDGLSDEFQTSFRRQYAAILLRERGQ